MIQPRISRTLQTLSRQQRLSINLQHPRIPQSSLLSSRTYAPTISQRPLGQRWYSQAQEAEAKKDESEATTSEHQKPGPEETQEDPVKKELEAKKKESLDLTDRLKRSIADYRNLQEQTKREVQAAKDFALQRFSKDLLESIDNLDRALGTVSEEKITDENQDLKNLYNGLKMTDTILMQTLKKHGLERFDPSENNDKFDPNKHEALFQTPIKDKEDGTVFHTQSKGFILNGRTLRAAKVGVVKHS